MLNRYSEHHLLNLHATLALGVRASKLGLIKAVDAFGAVLLDQTAFTDSAASGTNSSVSVPTQNLPFFKPAALSPPPPPSRDVFLRDSPLNPVLISEVIFIICHILR